jgi:myo-inositol 2-dehydrogenase/D-chiro-inositol 1-dehydrogenase
MKTKGAVRAGVIGLGRIGKIHADNIINYLSNGILAAVADPFLDKGYVSSLGIEKAYTDPKEIFNDPDIDAVVICSSTDKHVELIRGAIRAGKAVFCEKPVSHDPKKIDELIEEAKSARVPVQIGFNRRFDPNFLAVRKSIADGRIGKPRLIKVTSYDPAPPPVEYIRHSGGMLFDMSIHDFDMVRYLSGEDVTSVYAKGANLVDPKIGEAGDIDTAVVTLSFKGGAIGVILNCREAAYGYDQRIEVLGSKGGIQAQNVCPNTTVLSTAESVQTEKPLHFFLERYAAAYRIELGEFFQSVIDKKEPGVGLSDVKKAILIAQAATESLRQGRPVNI